MKSETNQKPYTAFEALEVGLGFDAVPPAGPPDSLIAEIDPTGQSEWGSSATRYTDRNAADVKRWRKEDAQRATTIWRTLNTN